MAITATHYGHCQICGSQQKLPGGVLSLHGYTVQWGFFSGVCSGANHKPFEQSKDLIDDSIRGTTARADSVEQQVAELTRPATVPKTWVRYKRKSAMRDEKDFYTWAYGEVIEGEYDRMHSTKFFVLVEDGAVKVPVGSYTARTVLEAATAGNRSYAQMLSSQVAQMREYVEWQKERVKNWKPAELQPVPESDRGSAKSMPKVHFEAKLWGYNSTICSGSAMGAQRNRFAMKTTEREKVTCAACLKALKEKDEAPARRAAEKAKERAREIKSLEQDIKRYQKWIKDEEKGENRPDHILHFTDLLNRATADLEKNKAEQDAEQK